MARIVLFILIVITFSITSISCEKPFTGREIYNDLAGNQKTIIDNQSKLDSKTELYQKQINNKIDTIMEQQREIITFQRNQYDYTQMLISEVRKSNQGNTNTMKIDISIDRGGYGEVAQFSNIDDAIKFINTFK